MKGRSVLTGRHFMHGDDACAEGAIAAGCSFFGGYPITPSTEVAELMSYRLPQRGGPRFRGLRLPLLPEESSGLCAPFWKRLALRLSG